MSDNVIRPEKFQRNVRSDGCLVLSQEASLEMYAALMNMLASVSRGGAAQHRLASEMSKRPWGMSGPDTLSAVSIVSNNALMMDKLRGCMEAMMKMIVSSGSEISSGSGEAISGGNGSPPDDMPPAA